MKDFREKPSTKIEYSLFLIKKPHNLNKQILQAIFEDLSKLKALISFEKLFKGRAGAQVIYGPKIILTKFAGDLNLLELEDYTNSLDLSKALIWETGINQLEDFKQILELEENEKLWFQMILRLKKGQDTLNAQARVVAFVEGSDRLKVLKEALPKIPKPFSMKQLTSFTKPAASFRILKIRI